MYGSVFYVSELVLSGVYVYMYCTVQVRLRGSNALYVAVEQCVEPIEITNDKYEVEVRKLIEFYSCTSAPSKS